MMELVFNLLAFIFTICFLILTHECGHFFVARIFKVKILKFSIGFGKAIFKWKDKLGIEYVIAWLPLGGYVKMLDTREMKVKPNELHLALDKKPFLQKMLIVFAGPLTNILFGTLVFWLIFVVGIKSPKPIIGAILPNSIASSAGLLAKDQIVAVDGKKAVNWQDVMLPLFSHLGDKDKITLGVVRSHENTPHNYDLDLVNWEVNPVDFDLFHDLGIEPYHPFIPAVIDKISLDSPAANSLLRKGDKVIKVDSLPVNDWGDFVGFIKKNPKQNLQLTIMRGDKTMQISILTGSRFAMRWEKEGFLGVSPPPIKWPPEMLLMEKYSLGAGLREAFQQTYTFVAFNSLLVKKLVTRKLPISVLGGPISVYQSSSTALNQGIIVYFSFLAIFSIMLAFINLIPIPGLDGGHILIFLIEGIIRRPIPVAVQILIFRLGIIFLILIAIQATFNDLVRIFS